LRPFLKWAGNKYRIREHILSKLPESKRLIEPFMGSGAIFMNSSFTDYLLADNNLDLVNLYHILQKEGEKFIQYTERLFKPENNEKEQYYALRDQFNNTKSVRKKSALFIYLNRHGYNGLCRYNSSGEFNVPFGRFDFPKCPSVAMQNFLEKSQSAEIVHADFIDVMKMAKKGDVVYCDPPYVPLTKNQ